MGLRRRHSVRTSLPRVAKPIFPHWRTRAREKQKRGRAEEACTRKLDAQPPYYARPRIRRTAHSVASIPRISVNQPALSQTEVRRYSIVGGGTLAKAYAGERFAPAASEKASPLESFANWAINSGRARTSAISRSAASQTSNWRSSPRRAPVRSATAVTVNVPDAGARTSATYERVFASY